MTLIVRSRTSVKDEETHLITTLDFDTVLPHKPVYTSYSTLNWFQISYISCVNAPKALWKSLYVNNIMDVVWLNRFKLNRFETGLSASVNGAIDT